MNIKKYMRASDGKNSKKPVEIPLVNLEKNVTFNKNDIFVEVYNIIEDKINFKGYDIVLKSDPIDKKMIIIGKYYTLHEIQTIKGEANPLCLALKKNKQNGAVKTFLGWKVVDLNKVEIIEPNKLKFNDVTKKDLDEFYSDEKFLYDDFTPIK